MRLTAALYDWLRAEIERHDTLRGELNEPRDTHIDTALRRIVAQL